MAQHSGLYNATEGSPEYAAADLARFFDLLASGVAYGYKNQLEVTAGAGLQVLVDSGGLISKGWFYVQDEDKDGASPMTLPIDAAASGNVRKDRIVVEFDTDNASASAKVLKGAESSSSATAPTLSSTGTNWQVSLAIVNVAGGVISSIEDERIMGSGRTKPEFTEGITAPNVTVTDVDAYNVDATYVNTINLDATSVDADNITAGNATIKDGGRIYLNTSKSAYLRYTSNALYIKLPSCVEVQIPGVVVGTSSTAPAGTYPINTMYLERD